MYLVSHERSGKVREAIRSLGFECYSCDIEPADDNSPFHYQMPMEQLLGEPFAGVVSHPVCKYMTNSGVRWLETESGRWGKMRLACDHFNLCKTWKTPRIIIENPVMHGYAKNRVGPASFFRQPWHYGDPFKKNTGFWTIGEVAEPEKIYDKPWCELVEKTWRMPPGPDRERLRSETEPGIAMMLACLVTGTRMEKDMFPQKYP